MNQIPPSLGVVHKLRLQDKVGRWSKNVHFFSTQGAGEGVGGKKKAKIFSN